jgi:hypothetical protein
LLPSHGCIVLCCLSTRGGLTRNFPHTPRKQHEEPDYYYGHEEQVDKRDNKKVRFGL